MTTVEERRPTSFFYGETANGDNLEFECTIEHSGPIVRIKCAAVLWRDELDIPHETFVQMVQEMIDNGWLPTLRTREGLANDTK